MSRWEIALINIMIIIINKCLFYYLYIIFLNEHANRVG